MSKRQQKPAPKTYPSQITPAERLDLERQRAELVRICGSEERAAEMLAKVKSYAPLDLPSDRNGSNGK